MTMASQRGITNTRARARKLTVISSDIDPRVPLGHLRLGEDLLVGLPLVQVLLRAHKVLALGVGEVAGDEHELGPYEVERLGGKSLEVGHALLVVETAHVNVGYLCKVWQ